MSDVTASYRFNKKMDAKINAKLAEYGVPNILEHQNSGFIDWYDTDVTHGFHVYSDDELTDILEHKAKHDVYVELPIIKMYFYQSMSDVNVEVDLNNPLHECLKWKLDFLDRESGKDRKNALARIRSIARKMGLKASKDGNGHNVLATDIYMVWRDEKGLISG